jgi:hypothetical protein
LKASNYGSSLQSNATLVPRILTALIVLGAFFFAIASDPTNGVVSPIVPSAMEASDDDGAPELARIPEGGVRAELVANRVAPLRTHAIDTPVLAVRVVDQSGAGLRGVEVSLLRGGCVLDEERSSIDGFLELRPTAGIHRIGLDPHQLPVGWLAPEAFTTWKRGDRVDLVGPAFEFAADKHIRREIQLTRSARLEGRVTEMQGTVIAGASVRLTRRSESFGERMWTTVSDELGGFAFEDLHAGLYELVSTASRQRRGAPLQSTLRWVELQPGQHAFTEVHQSSQAGVVRGRVELKNGSACSGYEVHALSRHAGDELVSRHILASCVTDREGSFELRAVPEMPLSIQVTGAPVLPTAFHSGKAREQVHLIDVYPGRGPDQVDDLGLLTMSVSGGYGFTGSLNWDDVQAAQRGELQLNLLAGPNGRDGSLSLPIQADGSFCWSAPEVPDALSLRLECAGRVVAMKHMHPLAGSLDQVELDFNSVAIR